MKSFAPLVVLILSGTAFGVPGAKRSSLGTIQPKQTVTASQGGALSLGESYALVGTISCDSCASPFQPVAVIRDLSNQKLLHMRVGDELALKTGEHAVVTVIGSGAVELRGSYGSYKLRAGGFPDEAPNDSTIIAKSPNYLPPPAGSVRW